MRAFDLPTCGEADDACESLEVLPFVWIESLSSSFSHYSRWSGSPAKTISTHPIFVKSGSRKLVNRLAPMDDRRRETIFLGIRPMASVLAAVFRVLRKRCLSRTHPLLCATN